MTEDRATRQKRLMMRAWRRGMREMDMILGPYAQAHLADMDAPAIAAFEAFLRENDQDLFAWITHSTEPVAAHAAQVLKIVDFLSAKD